MQLLTTPKILAAVAFISTSIATAATPIDGWYGSFFGGYAYLPNNISHSHLDSVFTDASYSSGYDVGGSFGFQSNPLRYDGELTYINGKINRFKNNFIQQTRSRSYTNAVLGMANVYYDFPAIISPIQPFLGVGIGYGSVNTKLKTTSRFFNTGYSNSDGVFAYQLTGGLTYDFAENYAISLGYRYVATDRVQGLGKVFQAHLGNLGVIYRFCDNNYK